MKFNGHINLQANEIQNMVLGIDTQFPDVPTVGRVVFVNKRVFIAVEVISGTPTWVPLTNELDTVIYTQNAGSVSWVIEHNLNTTTPLVQIYDANHTMVYPDSVEVTSNNSVTVTFITPQSGRAVVFHGSINGTAKQEVAFTHYETSSSSTWVIHHDLGYYPAIRVFSGSAEIQPLTTVHDSLFQSTITFSSPLVGYARLV